MKDVDVRGREQSGKNLQKCVKNILTTNDFILTSQLPEICFCKVETPIYMKI